jgi:hypothetical protein
MWQSTPNLSQLFSPTGNNCNKFERRGPVGQPRNLSQLFAPPGNNCNKFEGER